ncbi:hypothetical protein M3Y99_00497600 [Aphelenchoides fujianensis]|nr:hypothetical protein M3Y99_00497600 [Aphelenchoides fujianensis]
MIGIVACDFVLFLSIALMYMSRSTSIIGGEETRTSYYFFFLRTKRFITFVSNFALASSEWILTLMLLDHFIGIKRPFAKQIQDTSVCSAYVAVFFSLFTSLLFTSYNLFAFNIEKQGDKHVMTPRNSTVLKVFTLISVVYQYVIPSIAMFGYIFLIAYHIHQSQKVFSRRNEITHTATRSSSTDGLRVHRGGRNSDARIKVKILPRMLVAIATNSLLTTLPSAIVAVRMYILKGGKMYEPASAADFQLVVLSNACLLSGKIFFHLIVIVSHAPKIVRLLRCKFANPSESSRLLQESGSDWRRRKQSPRASSSTQQTTVVRRTVSNVPSSTQYSCFREEIELHELHSIRSNSMKACN